MRGFVKPTNPKTQAQLAVRAGFAGAAVAWNALDAPTKSMWNSYAATYFKPKKGSPGTSYSGFNAFMSMWNATIQAVRSARVATMTAPTATFTSYTFSTTAVVPAAIFNGSLTGTAGAALTQIVTTVTLTTTGRVTMSIKLSALSPATGPLWKDPVTGTKHGYVIFGGLPNNIASTDAQILAVIPPINVLTGWTVAGDTFTLQCNGADINISARKLWYSVGQKVNASVYALSEHGEYAPIGGALITVT
jgi:hypothetical protein